jgi:hypothetical protein
LKFSQDEGKHPNSRNYFSICQRVKSSGAGSSLYKGSNTPSLE